MATSAFDSCNTIIACFVGPEITPFVMKPVSDRCDELTMISEILDSQSLVDICRGYVAARVVRSFHAE